MQNHSSTKVKHREEIPKFHEDTPCKFQSICLKVISVYFFSYLRTLSTEVHYGVKNYDGLHCEIAVKSGFVRFHKICNQFLVA